MRCVLSKSQFLCKNLTRLELRYKFQVSFKTYGCFKNLILKNEIRLNSSSVTETPNWKLCDNHQAAILRWFTLKTAKIKEKEAKGWFMRLYKKTDCFLSNNNKLKQIYFQPKKYFSMSGLVGCTESIFSPGKSFPNWN